MERRNEQSGHQSHKQTSINKKATKPPNRLPNKRTNKVRSEAANQVADTKGMPEPMPFNKQGLANFMSVSELCNQGFRVYMDTNVEPAMFVESKRSGITRKFGRSKNGLFF